MKNFGKNQLSQVEMLKILGGDNFRCMRKKRNSDGSFLEAQDMFRLPGIFRSVSLTSTSKAQVRDFRVRPDLDKDYTNGSLEIEADIRNLPHFQDVKDYGVLSPWENEIGACENVRYVFTTLMKAWPNEGGAKTNSDNNTMISSGGTSADVYPILYLAKDAYGIVPLKGQNSLTPMIINPTPSESDPLAQRAHVSWKAMHTCVILNQAWMVRAEVAATAY